MKNQVNVRSLLDVYETVRRHGHYTERGIELDDVIGVDTGDGYSLTLSDGTVTVDLNFHNTYHFHVVEAEQNINHTPAQKAEIEEEKIAEFIKKLNQIQAKYPH
ncbi:DUF3081 family protein [Thaumasiovibrio sp. DFM-14]|uniref:DUF3081 family protein n=1 Tax=Thaumasiovibrio sp. DFM-14 TaxID=3384792 RepID=UPI0039A341CD